MKHLFTLALSFFIIGLFPPGLWAFDLGDVEIHGFISQGYLVTDHNNYLADTDGGTFEFNEMGVNFSTDLTDQLRVSLQVFSRDLGDIGNNDVVLGYAYGDYRWQNWLGIRAGKIKIDYGLYNETREMDMLRTGVMLPQSVYPEIWRDSFSSLSGGGVYGYVPAGVAGKFSYSFQIGAMEFDKDGGYARFFSPRLDETLKLDDMEADYACFSTLQWHTPLPGLKVKGSYYNIEGLAVDGDVSWKIMGFDPLSYQFYFDFTQKDGCALSIEYTWQNLTLSAEYAEDSYQVKFGMSENESMSDFPEDEPVVFKSPKITSQGWYIAASYRFTDWFEAGVSYSEYYPDKDDRDGDQEPPELDFIAWQKTTTLSTRFDINDFWVVKLESSYNDGFGSGIDLAENDARELEQYWWLFAAKVTFNF
ncbi:hypothetical protein DENIS_2977 [Desulfonema ishimotonii]|uniref:Porin n=1 Tax=Desulfonema ishimotonii TaxID=45657 RepID=A0A401FYI4_9BACT|nr:hypothetical protein [Desulfonema ishimotonii]GBC62014.1 hypothetical protein DENIS_2977 [Desulfonema ishimotonii]